MALSADADIIFESTHHVTSHTVAASVTVFKGALLVSVSTGGLVKPAVDETTSLFAGVALNGAAAAAVVEVVDAGFVWLPAEDNVDEDSLGKLLYCHDDASVTETSTVGAAVGRCMSVVGSDALVWLGMPAATPAS